MILRIDSKSKNRFSTLTTTTVESTFTNKLHLSLSTICNEDVIRESGSIQDHDDVISNHGDVICNHDDVIENINYCYSSEKDLSNGQNTENVFV